MDEQPKSIWKKPLHLPQLLLVWLGLMVATMLIFLAVKIIINEPFEISWLMIFGAVSATVLLAGWIFIRWLCCWRNLNRSLFALACFATLIALFYAEENWRGKHDWEKFKREWEAKGEKLEFKNFIPLQIPDEENFAMADVVASSYEYILTRKGEKISYEKRDTNLVNRLDFGKSGAVFYKAAEQVAWVNGSLTDLKSKLAAFAAQTNLFQSPLPTLSDAQNLLRLFAQYNNTIEDLRRAAQRPNSRFPLNYNTDCPAEILLPQLSAMNQAARLLNLRSLAELQTSQSDQALMDIKLMLRLAEAVRVEPFMISHLVRVAIVQLTLQPIYEGLAEHRWSDVQLQELDKVLAGLDFLADCQFCMRGEVGMQSGVMDYLQHQPKELANLGTEGNNNSSSGASRLIPTGWFYQNQLRCARFVVVNDLPIVNPGQQIVSPVIARQASEAWSRETRGTTPYNFIERILLPNFSVIKFAHAQVSVNLARTAIALERYRLANGSYSESLDALAPQFIAQMPHDVIGGQPLKYRHEANGQFVLYSIGWNERDDGGVTFIPKNGSQPRFEEGDWVWRYPAK